MENKIMKDFQYNLDLYTSDFKSDFLIFNIRSGGSTHDRIVEIGIVLVKEGKVYDKYFTDLLPPQSLIHENDFKQEIYKNSPTLKEAWREIQPYFEQVEYVGAFNLSVHKSNLEKSLAVYGLNLPDKIYFCAFNFAKQYLKEVSDPIYENVCYALSIDENQSVHNHLSKAIATSEIVLKIESIANISIKNYIESKPSKKEIFSTIFRNTQSDIDFSDLSFIKLSKINGDYFQGKGIVVTGIFQKYPDRKKLEDLLIEKGGIIKSGISPKTDIVIIGDGAGPSKIEKIRELKSKGLQIDLINEETINNL